jgi:hypothetical protein
MKQCLNKKIGLCLGDWEEKGKIILIFGFD